ncbi:hypothetical protein [Actinokineospora inagensis]|uniref:hypothetical protein n=1 Tax=Actinokineospora inagensis TaxID=103730 RepID=UPI0012F99655|nr:hypothetical protein [Actinokineospora inagensis]
MTSTNAAPKSGRRWLFLAVWLLWFAVGFPYPTPTWPAVGMAALLASGAATLMVLAATGIGWWQHRPRTVRGEQRS